MIAQLRGTVVAASLGELVVDVAGVGYRVLAAPGTLPTQLGAELTVHTHLVVREDAHTLYGFASPAARAVFTSLLAVGGVGPKLALAAIGTLGPDGVRRAVATEDVAALTVVPGIGRKGAQRMILELASRLGAGDGAEVVGTTASGAPTARAEVAEALEALGYASREVRGALDGLDADAAPEDLLRQALRSLGAAGKG